MASGYYVRVGDADREAVAAQLREHFADGRLTLEELNERLDLTFAAKTRDDLDGVMRDLPHVSRPFTDAPAWGPGNAAWPASRPMAGRSGWDYSHGAGWDHGAGWNHGAGRQRQPFILAPMLALVWVALVASAVMLFGIGGDRPLAIVLILAAFGVLKRLIGFIGGRGRGSRGPKGPRGPRRGPRGRRF
jgi:DUF1707 SHOCT-like domain